MNFRKLITYLTMGTAAAMPLAVAQNPTILQGNYISNVFGNSNFIKNPNAQTNIADVTVSNATVTRSTTTPLVATSEFLVTVTSANGTIAWNTRTFDQGMKGQNCEARFTYRGFQSTSVAQVRQGATVAGANVVARLALTASTDPRIASINFPCGDLSQPTYFVITDTATLSGTHEIGGAYIGLATNMANVAQAEAVGGYKVTVAGTKPGTTSATFANLISGTATQVLFGKATSSDSASGSVTFSSLPAGNYMIVYTSHSNSPAATSCQYQWFEDTSTDASGFQYNSGDTNWSMVSGYFSFTTATSRTFRIQGRRSVGSGTCQIDHAPNSQIVVYRFPSSSELVVTPERQNVWAGVVYTNQNQSIFSGNAEPTAISEFNNAVWNQPTLLKGKAQVTTTNSGNDLGFSVPNLPVGNYKLEISGLLNAGNGSSTDVNASVSCQWKIVETTTSTDVARQTHIDTSVTTSGNEETRDYINSFAGVFNNTSVATRNFRLMAQKTYDATTGNTGICQVYSNTGTNSNNTNITFLMIPLDQPSNSALYVQGPVKAAETGAAIPAGSVGYELSASSTADITTSTTELAYATLTGASIDVPAGVWLVIGEFFGYPGNASGGAGIINLGQIYNSSDSSAIISRRVHATPTTTNTSSGGGKTITTVVNLTSQKTLILRGAIQKAGGAETITSGGFFPSSQNTIRAIRLN